MNICETDRLILRHFKISNTEYIFRQLNEKSFIEYIADKKIADLSKAESYLKNGPITSYQKFGFGLNMIILKGSKTPIGMCGIINRAELKHPDLGFALLPEFWGKGYAREACVAILNDGLRTHDIKTVLGVAAPENQASNILLLKLGFSFTKSIMLYGSCNNLYEYKH